MNNRILNEEAIIPQAEPLTNTLDRLLRAQIDTVSLPFSFCPPFTLEFDKHIPFFNIAGMKPDAMLFVVGLN